MWGQKTSGKSKVKYHNSTRRGCGAPLTHLFLAISRGYYNAAYNDRRGAAAVVVKPIFQRIPVIERQYKKFH